MTLLLHSVTRVKIYLFFLFVSCVTSAQVFIPHSYWANRSALTISPTSTIVAVNGTIQFMASGGFSVRTFSIQSGVGSVDASTGLYTAPAAPGSAVVRVTDSSGNTADASISIVNTINGLTVSQSVLSGGIGAQFNITAQVTYTPSGSTDVTTVATWTTSNSSVATVSNGTIVFVGVGVATITVSYGGFSQTVSVTVAAKTLTSLTVTPINFSMPASATQYYTAIGTYSDASSQDLTTSVTWSTSSAAIATISNSSPTVGRARGESVGVATITATLGAISDSTSLTINPATLTAINILPYDFLGNTNMTYQLTAVGTYSDGSSSDVTEAATWSSSNATAATISNTAGIRGRVTTGSAAGYTSTTITATIGAVSGTSPFGVNSATVTSVIVKPIITIRPGDIYDLEAWANLSDGSAIDVTEFAVWNSATTANVTVSNGTGTKGRVTGVANGTSNVTAVYGGQTGSRTVTVSGTTNVVDVGIGLNAAYYTWTGGTPPSNPYQPAGLRGSRIDSRVNFAWATGNAPMGVGNQFAVRWTGYYEAINATNYFCTQSDDGVRVWINGNLVINNWTEHGATWDCTTNINLTPGAKYPIRIEFYENGGDAVIHFTRSSVSAADAQNNTTRIVPQANLYPYGEDPVVSLTVSQSVLTGGINSGANITAQAVYSTGSTSDVTNTATWTTSNAAVATVSNGVISYVGAGTATITASFGGFSQTISVTVQSKTLVSITVTPGTHSMAVYAIRNFTATGNYSDASTQDLTTTVTWSSSNGTIASISNTPPKKGRATGVATGSVTITATLGAVSGTASLTINTATLTSIVITPDDYLGLAGANYQMTATGTFSDASTSEITDSVTWSSSNTAAATISNVNPTKGLLSAQTISNYQTTTITATLGVSDTTPFGVNGSSVISVLVKPTVTITIGSTYSLQAWANLADGGSVNVTEYAAWTSSSPANVTVSNGTGSRGLVTGVANGTATITAQYSGVSGNRIVTVAGASSMTDIGVGLNADYYSWSGGSPPAPFIPANKRGSRIDAQVGFAWASNAAPMGIANNFAVRWTGFYQATSTTNYFCTYSDDGVRLWVNGVQVVNNWTDHGPTWNCTGNITLTIGTKYTVVMEFYENGGGAEAHLTRSSVSAADAQATPARLIPQVDLYPY